ncbi:MAG: Sensor histidine kinase YpdA, partial [Bacteroidota bacterium]
DNEGYMWFATDNGISRFDGYEFKNYGIQEGLTDLVVYELFEDKFHRIWITTLSNKIFYLEADQR